MKTILYLALAAVSLTACKKSKKEEPVTINTLLGTWQEQLSAISSARPAVYTFRSDSTFTVTMGDFVGNIQGTYSTSLIGSTVRALSVRLTPGTATTPTSYIIDITSHNQMTMTYGGTIGKKFARVQ